MEGVYHTKYLGNQVEDMSKTTDLSLMKFTDEVAGLWICYMRRRK